MEKDINNTETYTFFSAVNNELTDLLITAVAAHALNYNKDECPPDANIALSNILSKNIKSLTKLKSTTTSSNRRLLYSDYPTKLLQSIDISKLDAKLLLEILLKVPGFLTGCGCLHDENMFCSCQCECPASCDHEQNSCCGECQHPEWSCRICGMTIEDCDMYGNLCKCDTCLSCNKNSFHKNPSTPTEICPYFMYYYCLDFMLHYRNFFAHFNKTRIIERIEIGDFSFQNVPELKKFLRTIIEHIIKNIATLKNSFKYGKKEEEHRANFNSIFEHGTVLREYVDRHMEMIRTRVETLVNAELVDQFSSVLGKNFLKRISNKLNFKFSTLKYPKNICSRLICKVGRKVHTFLEN